MPLLQNHVTVQSLINIDTLKAKIQERINSAMPFAENQVINIVYDIAMGINFLHEQTYSLLHRNINVSVLIS